MHDIVISKNSKVFFCMKSNYTVTIIISVLTANSEQSLNEKIIEAEVLSFGEL